MHKCCTIKVIFATIECSLLSIVYHLGSYFNPYLAQWAIQLRHSVCHLNVNKIMRYCECQHCQEGLWDKI